MPEAEPSLSFRRDPNDPWDSKAPQWPPYTAGAQQYVSLNLRPLEVRRGLRAQACAFWNRFLPKLLSATGTQKPAGRAGRRNGKGARRERGVREPAGYNPSLLPPASEAPCTCTGPAHGEAAPRPRPGLPLSLLLLFLSRFLRL